MSGLVNGLQNRLRRFESARHLTTNSRNSDKQRIPRVFFFSLFQKRYQNVTKYKAVPPVNTTSHHPDKNLLYFNTSVTFSRACVYIEWKRKKEPTLPTLPTPSPPPTPPGGRGAGCLQGLKVQQNYSDSPPSGRGWGWAGCGKCGECGIKSTYSNITHARAYIVGETQNMCPMRPTRPATVDT